MNFIHQTSHNTYYNIRGIQEVTIRSLECANRWQYVASVTMSDSDKRTEVPCPPLEGHGCKSRDYKLAESCVNLPTRSPSMQARYLSLRLRHFGPHKKGSEGQTIHLGRRRQTVGPTCGTGSQRSPGNFTRQPFTALCCSPRPPARSIWMHLTENIINGSPFIYHQECSGTLEIAVKLMHQHYTGL